MRLLDPTAVDAPPGTPWCRAWTAQVDAAVTGLLADPAGVAIVALGGYARRELCPASDIDVLLLHNGWGRRDLEGLVQRLCYPLWDAGLTVGYAVRTPAEAVGDAAHDIATATALLERRVVAGDVGLSDSLTARVNRWSRRQGRRLVRELVAADERRHDRRGHGSPPDVKSGPGGLRDLHSLRWGGAWLLGDGSLDALVAAGYLTARERADLGAANDTLLTARCALHAAHPTKRGRQVDLLTAAGARAAGRPDLLGTVPAVMAAVAGVHRRTWAAFSDDASAGRRRRRGAK